jgi:hypothetical protein
MKSFFKSVCSYAGAGVLMLGGAFLAGVGLMGGVALVNYLYFEPLSDARMAAMNVAARREAAEREVAKIVVSPAIAKDTKKVTTVPDRCSLPSAGPWAYATGVLSPESVVKIFKSAQVNTVTPNGKIDMMSVSAYVSDLDRDRSTGWVYYATEDGERWQVVYRVTKDGGMEYFGLRRLENPAGKDDAKRGDESKTSLATVIEATRHKVPVAFADVSAAAEDYNAMPFPGSKATEAQLEAWQNVFDKRRAKIALADAAMVAEFKRAHASTITMNGKIVMGSVSHSPDTRIVLFDTEDGTHWRVHYTLTINGGVVYRDLRKRDPSKDKYPKD